MSSTCDIKSSVMLGTRGLRLPVVSVAPHSKVEVFREKVFDHILIDQFRKLFKRPREVVRNKVPKDILRESLVMNVIRITLVLPIR